MSVNLKKGDKIKGEKIRGEARKIKVLKQAPKTSRHKIQRVLLRNNAECEIEIETKHNTMH
jgi:acyl-coenzyme A synthetase/AMP-(fatty) acid ligase